MGNNFTAKKINFQGVPGYMVAQYKENKKVAEQFVPEKYYIDFCRDAGVNPVIIK